MFFDDLSNYSYYLTKPVVTVRNIGWLAKDAPFKTGVTNDAFLEKLACLIVGNDMVDIHVNRTRSAQPCNISGCTSLDVKAGEKSETLGASEIWIPVKGVAEYFAAPSMIYHYVDEHYYVPPVEFINAVLDFDLSIPYKAQDIYLNEIQGHF